jgi:hypothetical protein
MGMSPTGRLRGSPLSPPTDLSESHVWLLVTTLHDDVDASTRSGACRFGFSLPVRPHQRPGDLVGPKGSLEDGGNVCGDHEVDPDEIEALNGMFSDTLEWLEPAWDGLLDVMDKLLEERRQRAALHGQARQACRAIIVHYDSVLPTGRPVLLGRILDMPPNLCVPLGRMCCSAACSEMRTAHFCRSAVKMRAPSSTPFVGPRWMPTRSARTSRLSSTVWICCSLVVARAGWIIGTGMHAQARSA